MRTIKRTYKTLNGFLNACGKGNFDLDKVLDGYRTYKYPEKGSTICYVNFLDGKALETVAEKLAERYWSKGYHNRVVNKVMERSGDNSYLQGFQLEVDSDGEIFVGNILSGVACEYCKKMWLKSV